MRRVGEDHFVACHHPLIEPWDGDTTGFHDDVERRARSDCVTSVSCARQSMPSRDESPGRGTGPPGVLNMAESAS